MLEEGWWNNLCKQLPAFDFLERGNLEEGLEMNEEHGTVIC